MDQVLTESIEDNEETLVMACFYLQFHEHSCCELPKIYFRSFFLFPLIEYESSNLGKLAEDNQNCKIFHDLLYDEKCKEKWEL